MLRRSTLLLSATVLLAACCQARTASIEDERTHGYLNGRFWSWLGDRMKLAFVLGYCEGAVGECPEQAEFGEIVKGIDRFYQEPENLRLPFVAAMRVFAMEVGGAKATEIEAAMDAARKHADEPQVKVAPSAPPPK